MFAFGAISNTKFCHTEMQSRKKNCRVLRGGHLLFIIIDFDPCMDERIQLKESVAVFSDDME